MTNAKSSEGIAAGATIGGVMGAIGLKPNYPRLNAMGEGRRNFVNWDRERDLIIVGGGIGGVISLKYAKDAGLDAIPLESGVSVGGLWRDLPAWQDIQFRKEDWTLGDLPIAGEDQVSILANIRGWAERFGLSPSIRLNARVNSARTSDGGWHVDADGYTRPARDFNRRDGRS